MNDENGSVQSRAQQLLQGRLAAIEGLEQALARRAEAQTVLDAAQKDVDDSVSAARSAGWTTQELRQIGLPIAPDRRQNRGSIRRQTKKQASVPAEES